MNQRYEFQHALDHGYLNVVVPEDLSEHDVEMIEAHFAIIVRQCKRRAKKDA